MSTTKKVPMRKCVGCQEMKNKKEMLRVLKTAEGEFILDATGRKNGRGAYIPSKMIYSNIAQTPIAIYFLSIIFFILSIEFISRFLKTKYTVKNIKNNKNAYFNIVFLYFLKNSIILSSVPPKFVFDFMKYLLFRIA